MAQTSTADTFLQPGDRPEGDVYQWYLPAIGLDTDTLRGLTTRNDLTPITVAVIDTGIDYDHPELATDNLWLNTDEAINGIDDDNNGYVDDVLGWDFIDADNDPWDWVGHGTHVAGVIAATGGNDEGIAGINPAARIMALRAMNGIGRGASTRVAQAIYYAVDNGARVINLSIAIDDVSPHEQKAIAYARQKNVLVVVAAGNDGRDASAYTPASIPGVLTVAATDPDDGRAAYSNWGSVVDIAAPGTDILSLRAANSDFMHELTDDGVEPLHYAVGPDTDFYLATGTSFATPLVSAAASLLLSLDPELTAEDVRRILLQSARDLGEAGVDAETGFGLLNVGAALQADPTYFITASIDGVAVTVSGDAAYLEVRGTAAANNLSGAVIELGAGDNPERWKVIGDKLTENIYENVLGLIPQAALAGDTTWTIRLIVRHSDGSRRETRLTLNLG